MSNPLLHTRIKKLNDAKEHDGDCIIYIMSRDQRVRDNHALLAAQEYAQSVQKPLKVYFVLYPHVKNRIKNQFEWMLAGLKELEHELRRFNIPFVIKSGKASEEYTKIVKDENPAAVYFDFSPLRGPRKVKEELAENVRVPCFVVDTHNIVPVWVASDKEEHAAYTIRKKIVSKLDTYLVEPEEVRKQNFLIKSKENIYINIINSVKNNTLQDYVPVVTSGEAAASKVMRDFIENKLEHYAERRNNPVEDFQSNLSAYFHFGQISTLRVALEIQKAHPRAFTFPGEKTEEGTLANSIESFLEESIVRKELSDNFCFYNNEYDSLKGAKEWAEETLEEHKDDTREHVYTLEELEKAKTHDLAWNAAQIQMIRTGKMHGYMRMYWAKKILEWTNTPETALRFAITLNDKYELDGYDPNGYVGCMWSIAGIHDRGWTEREIFGKIRYMNFAGLKRKFAIEKYIEQWRSF